jgi:hypothetical protein
MPSRTITRIRPFACCAGMLGGALSFDGMSSPWCPRRKGCSADDAAVAQASAAMQAAKKAVRRKRFRVSAG